MITDTKQVGFIEDYKRILNDYYNIIDDDKKNKGKLKGAIVANLVKKYIEAVIKEKHLPFEVSSNNVFIEKCSVECDLLIVKKGSTPVFNAPDIYCAKDIKAIIECKATGIFIDKKSKKNPFLNELTMLKKLNENGYSLNFGYVTLAEQIPRYTSSMNLLNEANLFINDFCIESNKDKGVYCFAGNKPEDVYPLYSDNPYSFEEFIMHLCS